MSEPEPKIRCPSCGNEAPQNSTYCGNCGALLQSNVHVVNDATIRSGYGEPKTPPASVSEEMSYTGYGGPVLQTPITPRSGQNQASEFNDQVIQDYYGPTLPNQPPPPPGSTPPPEYRPTMPVIPPKGGNSRTSGKWRLWVIVGSIIVIILAGISFGIIVPYQNAQTSNAHATATAQARFNATVQANTLATAVSGTATASANATATAVASQYPFSNRLALNDPMYDNSHGSGWAEGSTNGTGGNCQFTQGAYHVSETQAGYYYNCLAVATNFSNFTYEVKMTIIKGDYGGIIFRAWAATEKLYYLLIAQDGSYFLFLIQNGNFQALRTGTIPRSIGFYPGLNQANTIGVVARGSTFDLYMNGQHFVSVTDSTYSEGAIGVTVDALNNPTEVAFSDAKVWML